MNDPRIFFAPVGTPLPQTADEDLAPAYSRGGWITTSCAHCGLTHDRPMAWLRRAGQWPVYLCHDHIRDCYHQVTVYGERLGARIKPETYDEWWRFLGLPAVPADVMIRAQIIPALEGLASALRTILDDITLAAGRWTIEPELPAEPDTSSPQQRALPRPATTPPMWANNPTKSRRKR